MNPCATFPPPIMYTNEYREKKIQNDVATIFFFSLKNKIKYSSKIRRYRNFSEFSLEKYISNDIKKKEKERKKYRRCGRGKTFLFVKNTKCLVDVQSLSRFTIHSRNISLLHEIRQQISRAIYRCSKDWIRNIGEKFEIGR